MTLFTIVARLLLLCSLAIPGFGQEFSDATAPLMEKARELWLEDGREDEAIVLVKEALTLDPESLEIQLVHGDYLAYLDRNSEAMGVYSAVIKKDRASVKANIGYAKSAMAAEEYGRVITSMTRFLRRVEGHPRALVLRARAYYWRDNLSRAIRDFEAVDDLSERPYALATYSSALMEDGQLEASVAAAERAVAADEEEPWMHYIHARALNAAGDAEAAAAAKARAIELDPEYADYEFEPVEQAELLNVFDPYAEPTAEEQIAAYVNMLKAFLVWAIVLGFIGLLVGLGGGRYLRPKEVTSSRAALRPRIQPEYDGPTRELMGIYLQNVAFTVLTFGVYRFWAKVRTQRFHYEHTQFADGRFDYHATGREKFTGFLKGIGFILPFIAGYYFTYKYAADRPEHIGLALLIAYFPFLALYLIRPIAVVGGQRFNLARTSWNNLRFRFTGTVRDAYRLYAQDLFVMVITLGFYYSWHQRNVREFKLYNTTLGEERMGFVGTGREMFSINLGGSLMSMLTLGFYVPWWLAARQRYFIQNTKFMGKRFQSSLKGMAVLAVGGPGMLVSIFTLGLGLPWAITRWRTLLAVTTTYMGEIDAAKMSSIADAAATSTLEGVGEAGEFLGEIGDIFGV